LTKLRPRIWRLLPAIVLLVIVLIPLFFLSPEAPPEPQQASAYDFFSGFLPPEELIEGENGSLLWRGRELKFCEELRFPTDSSGHSTATGFPRQNTYTITPTGAEGLILNVSVTDDTGRELLPGDAASVIHDLGDHKVYSKAELYSLRLRLLVRQNGVWYTVYDDVGYHWEGGQRGVRLFPYASDMAQGDEDVYIYPLPSGSYALALCGEDNSCYGLVDFTLNRDPDSVSVLLWDGAQQKQVLRTQNLRQAASPSYQIKDVQATLYVQPYTTQ